jgi:hypothetical protein
MNLMFHQFRRFQTIQKFPMIQKFQQNRRFPMTQKFRLLLLLLLG